MVLLVNLAAAVYILLILQIISVTDLYRSSLGDYGHLYGLPRILDLNSHCKHTMKPFMIPKFCYR
jgi:hypothetical protein